jgi:DNA polymerase I-like protein with 3'-5' exonuclease and polymerase domains/uracil-DNA glycosylase
MSYDPVAHGARCSECPLQGCRVVPPESHSSATIAVVGEAPGEQEEKIGKPLVGPSGNEFMKAARGGGLRRNDFHITSAILCRPPNNELKKLLAKISKWNKGEAKASKEEGREANLMKTPLECCKPRLDNEIGGFDNFLTLGGTGTKAVSGVQGSILALRGGLMELDRPPNGAPMRVMPTLHPSFVLRQQKWAHVLRNDVAKAARWFRGDAEWVPPKVTYNPGPETLRTFLSNPDRIYTFDIETDGIECLTAHIRCLAIGDATDVVVIGFRSNDQPKDKEGLFLDFYDSTTAFVIGTILGQFFEDETIVKAGHNAGYYDRLVLQNQMGVDPKPVLDTMLLHKSVESELPHSLAYVASLYTEAPSWKTDRAGNKIALGGESDEALAEYCANDVAITARVLTPLADQTALRDQAEVWRMDQKMQRICGDMHSVGMFVDQEKRLVEERKLLGVRHMLLTDIRDRLGMAAFNPGSVYQMRDVLFTDWGLESHIDATDLKEKETMTGGGDRSTGDLILRTLLTLKTVPKDQREIIKLMRRYRKCLKVLGTYVVKLRPSNMGANLGWDDDDEWVDKELRKKYGEEKRGIVDPRTGRMHPGYNAHVAVCVDPATWLLTEQGPMQIGKLGGFGPEHTEREACGLRLHDGDNLWPVSHLQNPGVCPTLRFETVLGVTLTATPHHRVKVAEKRKFLRQDSKGKWHPTEPEAVWRRMDELEKGDYALVPVGMEAWAKEAPSLPSFPVTPRTNANHLVLPDAVSTDLAYFAGVYNADGSLHDANGSFAIRISDTKGKRTEALSCLASRLFGSEAVRVGPEGLSVTSVSLAPWVGALDLGRRIENKGVPWWVLGSPRPVVVAYLRGLALDSSVGLNEGVTPYWRYTGTETLCREVQMLLLNMGIVAGLYDRTTPRQPKTWELIALGSEARSVADLLQVFLPEPERAGDKSQARPKYIRRGNHLWLRVKTVEDAGDRQVYDVTIPSVHQFWANGTVSHNTGRLSSSKPINAQNFPSGQRGIIVPAPGHVLVGADMDQLELRIAAALWGARLYLTAFAEEKDPHSMTAFAVFGNEFCKAAGLQAEQFSRPGKLVGKCYDKDGVFLKGASADATSMRNLSKAVQYASIEKSVRTCVLDERRSVPISEMKPGDWTWAWSTKRHRYEPTQVKHAWCHGEKECVEVTFSWNAPKLGGRQEGSVVVTADHPMLLRNGKLRHAGSLQEGDRLMPFRRGEQFGKYAAVAAANDGVQIGEHRAVMGFYEAGERLTHVHHKDGNPLNNRPDNLEIKDHLSHYNEHKEAIDAGRVNSEKWRASVSDPETRSAASKKAWEGRRERQDTDKTFGPRGSVLDVFADEIGVLKDSEVAELAGCSSALVGLYRKERDIPPPVGQQGWLRWLLTNEVIWNRLLHDKTNVEMTRLITAEFGVTVTRTAVGSTRKLLGIPAVKKARNEVYPRRSSKLDPFADRIGYESDAAIAAEVPCAAVSVSRYRKTHGIPAYWKEAPSGTNHKVVSIKSVGVREVWDLEVDHEDHNFALAAGIFVHNSQYMATVETVHKLIQKTELPSVDPKTKKPRNDGTTDLPYAKLPLRRVREMRDNWLEGAREFEFGWEKEIDEYRHLGYLREPVGGRRRDFLDGEEPNQIVNFKVQGGAAGLMNKAIVQLHEAIPPFKWGPGTGIINQCHDSIVVECPEEASAEVAGLLEECLNQTHPDLPGVVFSASADKGMSWKEVG